MARLNSACLLFLWIFDVARPASNPAEYIQTRIACLFSRRHSGEPRMPIYTLYASYVKRVLYTVAHRSYSHAELCFARFRNNNCSSCSSYLGTAAIVRELFLSNWNISFTRLARYDYLIRQAIVRVISSRSGKDGKKRGKLEFASNSTKQVRCFFI